MAGQSEYASTGRFIESMRRPVLFSHMRPDGDALGSLISMHTLLTSQGKSPVAVTFEPTPSSYAFLDRLLPMSVLGVDVGLEDLADADGVIVMDTCTYNQLEPVADWLRSCRKDGRRSVLAVDHHVNRDELADHYLVDDTASATCLMLFEWARALGWEIGPVGGEALFLGLATDTGWFRYSNTDDRTFRAAASLAEMGIEPHRLHQLLFQKERAGRIRLLGAALSSLRMLAGGGLAVMTLTPADYDRCEAEPGDTENIVNEPLRVDSVTVSAIIVDHGDGVIRCSLRSKAPLSGERPDIDVSSIAKSLGGGGHRRAAAARISGALPVVTRRVIEAVESSL